MFDWREAFKKLRAQKEESNKIDFSKKQPLPPNPYFQEVTALGEVVIGFESEIKVVPNMTMINNGTISIDHLDSIFSRRLNSDETHTVPVISVEVIPSKQSNSSELTFLWNATAEDKYSLHI